MYAPTGFDLWVENYYDRLLGPGWQGEAMEIAAEDALPTELEFQLLREAADEADLDVTDEEIRHGHHRVEPFRDLARKAYAIGHAKGWNAGNTEGVVSSY